MKTEVGNIVAGLDVSADMVQVSATTFSDQADHTGQESGFFLNEHYGDANVESAIDASSTPFYALPAEYARGITWWARALVGSANAPVRSSELPATTA